MSSPSSNIPGRKRKRGKTRRVWDDQGNIKVIKYRKTSSGLRIPGLTWGKVPSLLVGLPIAIYCGLLYSNRKGYVGGDSLGREILESTDELSAAMKLIVTGTIGMVLSGFLAYSLLRKGFKIRRYGAASREIIALWATFIVLSAIISPFVNEPGLVRQQSDDDFVPDDRDFDISGLSSPFYSEFLNGLLDLLGNIPDPKEEVGYIRPAVGPKLDYFQDRYLYRWRVAETYDTGIADFEQGYTSTQLPYVDRTLNYTTEFAGSGNDFDHARKFNIEEQYLTISNEYVGDALVPWNSEYGGLIGNLDSVDAEVINNGSLIDGSATGYRDINEQPVLKMKFDKPRTQGFANYDAYWIAEDKDRIADFSVNMSQITDGSAFVDYNQARFGDLSSADTDEISGIWGLKSLPGDGDEYYTNNDPVAAEFVAKHNNYQTILDNSADMSAYNFALLVNNDIQNAVIQGLIDGSLNIDPTQTSGVADPPSEDKAYWFYDALENSGKQYGMKELLAGFVNMLRSFDIPARPIIGFSVGDFQYEDGSDCTGNDDCDKIEILFEHIHVWIEVLIPVEVGDETTYHWGIFNPIPDPWLLQEDSTDFEFGQNALGGSPDIEIEITSGNPTSLLTPISVDPFPTTDTFVTNKMGKNLTGNVRISYDGNGAEGQTVSLRLVNETEMLSGDLDPDIGIELPKVITSTDGLGNFTIFVNQQGQVFTYNDSGMNPDPIPDLRIEQVDPLQSAGDIGLYGIIAIYSLNFNGSLTGWELDANLELTANVTASNIINPNTSNNVTAYGALFDKTVEFSVTVTDNDLIPLEGVQNIQFLLLTESDYDLLLASLILQILDNSLITSNSLGLFSITNQSGIGSFNVTFDQAFIDDNNKPANEIYVALALIQAGFKYNPDPVYVWFERNLGMDSILYNSTGSPIPDDGSTGLTVGSPSATWEVVTNVTAFENPGGQVFPIEPAVGVDLQYYIIKQSVYDANNGTWFTLKNNVLDLCSQLHGVDCYTVTVNTGQILNGINLTGDVVTQPNGLATVTFDLINLAFASEYYYIVVTAEAYSAYTRTSLFFASTPPGGLLLNSLNTPTGSPHYEHVEIQLENVPNANSPIFSFPGLNIFVTCIYILSLRRFN